MTTVTMTTGVTDASPGRRNVDVVLMSVRDNDDDVIDDDDYDDDDAVTSRRAPAVTSRRAPATTYLRQARMSICKLTSDYIRRFPSGKTRKDRSATRRERKATKTLAIVLGQHSH